MLLTSNLISFVRVAHYARKKVLQISARYQHCDSRFNKGAVGLGSYIEAKKRIFHLSIAVHVSTSVLSSTVANEIVDGSLGSSK
jgi:hypothetical protein